MNVEAYFNRRIAAALAVAFVFGVAYLACTGQQRRIARDVLDVIEVVCAPTDDRGSCLDKLVSMRAREVGMAGSASAAAPVPPPPSPSPSTGASSPAPVGSK